MADIVLYTILVLGAYLFWLGYVMCRNAQVPRPDAENFYLANRSVGKWSGLLTLWATIFSAGIFIGGAGLFYTHGVGTIILGAVAYPLIGVVILWGGFRLQQYAEQHGKVTSPISLLLGPLRFNALEGFAVLVTFLFLLPTLTMQIAGIGRLLESSLEFPYVITIFVTFAFIAGYATLGGLRTVIRTDVRQAAITLIALFAVTLFFLWDNWGMNVSAFWGDVSKVQSGALLEVPGPLGFYTFWTLTALIIMHVFIPITQPQTASRLVALRSREYLKTLAVLFPLMSASALLIAGVLGFGGAVIHPGLASGDSVVGAIFQSVPPLLGALALFGILTATMSTADSVLLSLGHIITESSIGIEVLKNNSVLYGRVVIMLAAAVAFLLSINPPQLIATLSFLSLGGLLQLAPIYTAGLMQWTCGKVPALLSIIGGVVTMSVFQWLLPSETALGIHPALWGFAVAVFFVTLGVFSSNR